MPTGLPDWYLGFLIYTGQLPLKINYYAQSVPMVPRREWEVEAECFKTFAWRGTVSAGSTSEVIAYTTGSDEVLYVCDFSFWGKDTGELWVAIGPMYRFGTKARLGDGKSHAFSLPLRVGPSTDMYWYISNPTSADVYYELYVWAYVLTA